MIVLILLSSSPLHSAVQQSMQHKHNLANRQLEMKKSHYRLFVLMSHDRHVSLHIDMRSHCTKKKVNSMQKQRYKVQEDKNSHKLLSPRYVEKKTTVKYY